MKIYAVYVGTHDPDYLAYFLKRGKAKIFKKECENAPTFEEWEKKPEIIQAKSDWNKYKDELNLLYPPNKSMSELPSDVQKKWNDLILKWVYNSNWGHEEYYIAEIEVIE